jgi:hypothetical protein
MNIAKLNTAMDSLKDDLGEGLIAANIFTASDGLTITAYNSQPRASALFNQVTSNLIKILKAASFPGLGKYYIIDLEENNMVIILPLGDYRWGILLDTTKVQLGVLVSIAIPNCIDAFEEANSN